MSGLRRRLKSKKIGTIRMHKMPLNKRKTLVASSLPWSLARKLLKINSNISNSIIRMFPQIVVVNLMKRLWPFLALVATSLTLHGCAISRPQLVKPTARVYCADSATQTANVKKLPDISDDPSYDELLVWGSIVVNDYTQLKLLYLSAVDCLNKYSKQANN